jgi:Protein of unknown function (DUF2851)
MREELLHFIWRFRHFDQRHLYTESGETLRIIYPGRLNGDQGPDFLQARIYIGSVLREGPVELHVLASDWFHHGHDGDIHYRDTILHVVWANDWQPFPGQSPTPGGIPLLVLSQRVSKLLLSRYERLLKSPVFVPCEHSLAQVDDGIRTSWQKALTVQRLERRTLMIRGYLRDNCGHWEETTWWLMARAMGLPVNGAGFEAIARTLPVTMLARYRFHPHALKALLLGQAGLLERAAHSGALPDQKGARDDGRTGSDLKCEYNFLRTKYRLTPIGPPLSFLRMRPAHFPGIRLTQLAALQASGNSWFPIIREAATSEEVMKKLKEGGLPGADMRRGLLINAFIPLLYAYGHRDKALQWLGELKAEKNHILRGWAARGVVVNDAAGSQALLELKKEYCDKRRCLDCAIGRHLLRSDDRNPLRSDDRNPLSSETPSPGSS